MIERRRPSYWEWDALPASVEAPNLPARVDVLVVGAGFMGRWLAYWLTRRGIGADVLVVERDRFTYGASSRNAGFLTCGQVSEMLADVESTGMDAVVETFEHRRRGIDLVRREFPDLEIERCGSTDWDPLTEAKRDLARELNAVAGEDVYSVRRARMGDAERDAMFNRADGALDPVRLLGCIRDRADARFAFGVRAARVSDGVAVLETVGGTREVSYERAFLCTNAFSSALDAGTEVRPGRGQIIVTSPTRTPTDRTLGYIQQGYNYFRFVGDRLLIGGGRHLYGDRENGTTELAPTASVRSYLSGVAACVLGHDDFRVEHHWAGIMGFRGGRHLGGSPRRVVDARTEEVAGFGGMGVALTPVVAREIAEEFA
jgi:glycine/D-amino acid oxidase-like deaminating enzyme